MKIITLLLLTILIATSAKPKEVQFFHISGKIESLSEISNDSAYTMNYCWTEWCRGCIISMKSSIIDSKRITDSLGLPIKYNAILYADSISESSEKLITNAYKHGIDIYFRQSENAFTQKYDINSDFNNYKGFKKMWSVPRRILVDKNGKLISSDFLLSSSGKTSISYLRNNFPDLLSSSVTE